MPAQLRGNRGAETLFGVLGNFGEVARQLFTDFLFKLLGQFIERFGYS